MMSKALSESRVEEICSHLENTGTMLGIQLNRELSSVELLEGVLLSLTEVGDESALNGGIFMSGIYLGEIIRANIGGDWIFSEEFEQFALNANGVKIYPITKVKKFVRNPEEEGLVFYAEVIIAKNKRS